MAKIKYYYDTETCKYERVKTTIGDVILNAFLLFFVAFAIAIGIFIVLDNQFQSPKKLLLKNEITELKYYYANLSKEVDKMNKALVQIERRDDNIYRVVLGADPIERSIQYPDNQIATHYEDVAKSNISHKNMVIRLVKSIEDLKHSIYIESKSQDEVVKLAQDKEKLFAAIPAIQPISNRELYALASGYGLRIHPIYKIKKKHLGIDFSASVGTPIYATADGVVKKVKIAFSGYGKMVEIDHGFGFLTRYAHMHGFAVKRGQHVKRGELIGYVGNTGLSTAPHLHYEIMINGKHVNPVYYFFNDLNPSEYEKIIELASVENQSLGM